MAKVELKQPIVDEIANSIKDAQAVVLVNYSGLTVEQDTILRKELREAGVQYKVYKNTMMNRAFAGTACEEPLPSIWKEQTLWLFPQQMLQHRQESLLNMQNSSQLLS